MSDQALVSAPIRYGRKSATRGGAYTMVFSAELCLEENHLGSGILVACRHPISTIDDLVAEAEYLWAAEQNTQDRTGTISAAWGCIAVLANPNSRNIVPFLDGWAKRIGGEKYHGQLGRALGEIVLVDPTGRAAIPWPHRKDGNPIDFDILLITATDPTISNGRYPVPDEIAAAWKTPSGRPHMNYFWDNRKHGIQTFQDIEIEALLKSKEN